MPEFCARLRLITESLTQPHTLTNGVPARYVECRRQSKCQGASPALGHQQGKSPSKNTMNARMLVTLNMEEKVARLFVSYSHHDEQYRAQLQNHLSLMQREKLIEIWHDNRIRAGEDFESLISAELEAADVILLLVSSDFTASDYCFGVEMKRAMERHENGSAVVVPIIVRPCDWKSAPFGRLKTLPKDGKAIVKWPTCDEAYVDIAHSIRELVTTKFALPQAASRDSAAVTTATGTVAPARPRSSSLSLRREFTGIDRDRYLDEGFSFIKAFFENSIEELAPRNLGYEATFRVVSEHAFTGTVYKFGNKVAGCYIRIGSEFGRSRQIAYSNSDAVVENSLNESLRVDADDQTMFLTALMGNWSGSQEKLTYEGAAEKLWQMFIGHFI